ncbi:hypothetical protein RHMOL_Rhmol12G0111100 [Rhododendron molle]|uniref:Uncharacterized protein n=1 Tax=Rhododendron molle TaxID=49168 RepID=A0ACC0LGS2_RHOML|nr:hypothetical protein RHMOL_Rhmol12G0111100 [Rhododendron molle]
MWANDEVMPVMMVQSSTIEEQLTALTKTLEKHIMYNQLQEAQLKELSNTVDQVGMSRCSKKRSYESMTKVVPRIVLKTSLEPIHIKPKTFEELATQAHDMELTVSISEKDDDVVPEWQDEWHQENSSSSELKASGEPLSQESESSVGSPKSECIDEEDEEEATTYVITKIFEPSNLIAPRSQQVILQSTLDSKVLLDTSLNYLPSSQV